MYKLILLDADNTIFDYDRTEEFALLESLKHFEVNGNYRVIRETYRKINSEMWKMLERGQITKSELRIERFDKLFMEFNLDISSRDFSSYYLLKMGEGSFLLDGAEDLCRYLSKKYRLVILTNGIKDVQESRIKGSKVYEYIEHIVTSDEAGCHKPDKRIFEWAFSKINHDDKKSAIIIGDSFSSDIQGGINFGIDTCWFNFNREVKPGSITPTYEVKSLKELHSIF